MGSFLTGEKTLQPFHLTVRHSTDYPLPCPELFPVSFVGKMSVLNKIFTPILCSCIHPCEYFPPILIIPVICISLNYAQGFPIIPCYVSFYFSTHQLCSSLYSSSPSLLGKASVTQMYTRVCCIHYFSCASHKKAIFFTFFFHLLSLTPQITEWYHYIRDRRIFLLSFSLF